MKHFSFLERLLVILLSGIIICEYCTEAIGPCILLEPHATSGTPCIPVDFINEAFATARHKVGLIHPFSGPHIKHHHEEIDKIGNALVETSRIIAAAYHLDWQQIYSDLPNLDIALTDIWEFCPVHFKHKVCKASRYRSLSGHCNNLKHPDWGATLVPFANILRPTRSDGISGPRDDTEGDYLPSARLVSSVMHRDTVVHDHSVTTMLIAWGQIIDHDITLTGDTKDPITLKEPECCDHQEHQTSRHHNCFPIEIPKNDHFYRRYGRHCMNFLRSFSGVRSECRLGPRTAFNTISSYLDANFAYGSTPELGKQLRVGKYGLLKSLPVFHEYGLKPLLPPKIEEPEDGCIRPNGDVFCFLAGDNRVNEQLILTVLHTIFLREHNRIAEILLGINPHWDDELIFQEARRVVIATTQHITFNEFLPMVLGKHVMAKYGLDLQETGYWNGYDGNVNPTAAEEFITSAFRFGHSLLPNRIERWSLSHRFIDSEPLHKLLRQPYDVYRPGYIDTFIMGLVNQLAQAMDEGVTEEVTTLLFKEPQHNFGMDLAAMNIQRGREHGVPGYTSYRKICGLSPVVVWEDLVGVMRNETVLKYRSVYRSPHDIDLWSGGVSEITPQGSLVGPTFACIIAQQFHVIKHGDRFWYELGDWPSSFTPEQLQEIRKVRLSRLLCDNSDDIKSIQHFAMVFPDPDLNPRVSCQSLKASGIDFEKWRDLAVPTHLLPEHLHTHQDIPESPSPILHESNDFHLGSHAQESEEDDLSNLYRLPPALNSSLQNSFSSQSVINEPLIIEHIHYSQHSPTYNHPHEHYNSHSIETNVTQMDSTPDHFSPVIVNFTSPRQEYVILKEVHTAKKVHRPRKHQRNHKVLKSRLPPVRPYPENHPFPGMDGLFSPNPGYLVRQKFMVYRAPPPPRQSQNPWVAMLG
ncbi:unnamed protein product [Allacma fusca]|uniref:Chorion peroxidase n=1 Tax=Allacma fusca TaxID=39272 RepID=A0A8J2KPG1_9HEXA|nr:unnamed protein product [Allacma fusca]